MLEAVASARIVNGVEGLEPEPDSKYSFPWAYWWPPSQKDCWFQSLVQAGGHAGTVFASHVKHQAPQVAQRVKNMPEMQETWGSILG